METATKHNDRESAHIGWSSEEETLLVREVQAIREAGLPLKSAFERVANKTGRRPNSIRNYYYARVNEGAIMGGEGVHNPAFVPFTDEEIRALVRHVLREQARGKSVRACTLEMGGGDNRAMLRFQNKYRSVIRQNPALVRDVMREMEAVGEPVFDPYSQTPGARKVGRPRKSAGSLLEAVGGVVNELDRVEGLDVAAFFESLGALALAASKGSMASERLREVEQTEDAMRLLEENRQLKEDNARMAKELTEQRARFMRLLTYFRQLTEINREFLGLNSVVKVSNLSGYVNELTQNLAGCEEWMSR